MIIFKLAEIYQNPKTPISTKNIRQKNPDTPGHSWIRWDTIFKPKLIWLKIILGIFLASQNVVLEIIFPIAQNLKNGKMLVSSLMVETCEYHRLRNEEAKCKNFIWLIDWRTLIDLLLGRWCWLCKLRNCSGRLTPRKDPQKSRCNFRSMAGMI